MLRSFRQHLRPSLCLPTLCLVLLVACQGLSPGASASAGGSASRASAGSRVSDRAPDSSGGVSVRPNAVAAAVALDDPLPANDPLRDPRERRLRHVRQLTTNEIVASPRFSADGQWLYFLERSAAGVTLRRVHLAAAAEPAEAVALAVAAGNAWALVDGVGDPCVAIGAAGCSLEPWPEPLGLLPCPGVKLLPVSAHASCPRLAASDLPCAVGPHGAQACPRVSDAGTQIVISGEGLVAPGGSLVAQSSPRGSEDGLSLMPAFSRDGRSVVFVSQPKDGLPRLLVTAVDRPEAEPAALGPEASRTLDPTFSPAGDRVLFASTVDDSAGQELDLQLASLTDRPLERITFAPGVDRFPAFSPDGHRLAWVSARSAGSAGADLFLAEWVDDRP